MKLLYLGEMQYKLAESVLQDFIAARKKHISAAMFSRFEDPFTETRFPNSYGLLRNELLFIYMNILASAARMSK